ncbi:MAG: hypothetical protein KF833_00750 [Verrucomicrobiae bacterium]|nr:hypothetical protein [Verrucomicrobiae bacterium]
MNDRDLETLAGRVERCGTLTRAIRALRWCREWPAGHADRPAQPGFVRDFEKAHGPLPASAERIMAEFQPEDA